MQTFRKAVLAAAVVAVASAAVAAAVLARSGRPEPVRLAPVAARPQIGFGPSPESWPPSDAGPLAELEFTRRDDLAGLDLRGQFAAELAATTASGASRGGPGPAEVLAEHQRIRRELAGDEHPVVLLRGADLARAGAPGDAWLTLAVGDFADRAAVTAWCAAARAGHCVPLRLAPPR
ncbi:hypothetical protein BJY16_008059 [Actinoplanes octamycinicus]|uniref:SPOR domain-containing protein n=1 Tax=Actinoplanes octamycinicus TaxID=135948 RepID=A0A7W7MC96_9ACTN|nr:hypothetical protein [Actinoplanes octamycinicus]MBB4744600.1 hypothetical protein [Actinoplanes octamycinicus]GIE63831.1 hypothetical protein Aoc01nite_92330 [Actinoplanes octamycinicus]